MVASGVVAQAAEGLVHPDTRGLCHRTLGLLDDDPAGQCRDQSRLRAARVDSSSSEAFVRRLHPTPPSSVACTIAPPPRPTDPARFSELSCQQSCQRLGFVSTISAEGHMAIRRSGRPTADPRPPRPGQPGADPVPVHSRRDLLGFPDTDSHVRHRFDERSRYGEVSGFAHCRPGRHPKVRRPHRLTSPRRPADPARGVTTPMEQGSMRQLGVVHRNTTRALGANVEALAPFGVSTLHGAMGHLGLMCSSIRPTSPTARLCGAAVTAVAAERQLDAACGKATVGTGRRRRGRVELPVRGMLLRRAVRHVDARSEGVGLVRDGAAPEPMNFPVFAGRSTPRPRSESSWGSVSAPIVGADALVRPGDVSLGRRGLPTSTGGCRPRRRRG
jgi:4-hydroxy-4-methyl-2-oxoglutarate aldolase